MLNIAYTQEMKHQDQLWNEQKEDFEIMERLQNEIVNQAKQNELLKDCYYITYFAISEVITEVYESEQAMNEDKIPYIMNGNCKSIITGLNNIVYEKISGGNKNESY